MQQLQGWAGGSGGSGLLLRREPGEVFWVTPFEPQQRFELRAGGRALAPAGACSALVCPPLWQEEGAALVPVPAQDDASTSVPPQRCQLSSLHNRLPLGTGLDPCWSPALNPLPFEELLRRLLGAEARTPACLAAEEAATASLPIPGGAQRCPCRCLCRPSAGSAGHTSSPPRAPAAFLLLPEATRERAAEQAALALCPWLWRPWHQCATAAPCPGLLL